MGCISTLTHVHKFNITMQDCAGMHNLPTTHLGPGRPRIGCSGMPGGWLGRAKVMIPHGFPMLPGSWGHRLLKSAENDVNIVVRGSLRQHQGARKSRCCITVGTLWLSLFRCVYQRVSWTAFDPTATRNGRSEIVFGPQTLERTACKPLSTKDSPGTLFCTIQISFRALVGATSGSFIT